MGRLGWPLSRRHGLRDSVGRASEGAGSHLLVLRAAQVDKRFIVEGSHGA
jgi:hypothetical protein